VTGVQTCALPISANGWASNHLNFTPAPPSGQWHYYCANATDANTNTWSGAYIIRQDDNLDVAGNFLGFKGINFVSAYRDNLLTYIKVHNLTNLSRFPKPGDTVRLVIVARKTNAVNHPDPDPYHFDNGTIPVFKITRWNTSNNTLEYWTPIGTPPALTDPGFKLFSTGYIIDGTTLFGLWTFDWVIPSTMPDDHYTIEAGGSEDGGDKYSYMGLWISSDPTYPVFDAIDFATGFPFY